MDGDIFDNPFFQAALAPVNLVGDALDNIPYVGPYIVPAALTLTGNPEIAAAYTGIRSGEKSGDPLTGMLSAAGSYGGNVLGSEVFGPALSDIGSSTNAITGGTTPGFMGRTIGDIAGNTVGDLGSLGGQTVGNVAGGFIGSQIGESVANSLSGFNPNATPQQTSTPAAWRASRSPSLGLPGSLSASMGGLSPQQQSSGIATQGVYGGGVGGEESKYFTNLINNRLVDDAGNVGSMDQINPVEQSYLAQLGLGGSTDTNDLLKRISNYQSA